MPVSETFRFVVEAVTDKAQGALDGLEKKAGTAASALRDKLTDGANKAVGAITGRVPDASRALDKLEGSATDAGAALDKAAGEAKAFDGKSYRADLELDGGKFEKTAHDLQDDIHKVVEEADRKVEVQIDASHAKQELREVGDAAEHAGRQEIGSIDSLRDVSGALGDVGGSGLDAADGILGFGEALAMTVPGGEALLGVLGPAGFAVGALAVGAGLLGQVLGKTSQREKELKEDTDALAKAFAGLSSADPAKRFGAITDKLDELLTSSPEVTRHFRELGVSGTDVANAMRGLVAPSVDRVRTELGGLRTELEAATRAEQEAQVRSGVTVSAYDAQQVALGKVAAAHQLTTRELLDRIKVEGDAVSKVDELAEATRDATTQDDIRRQVLAGLVTDTDDAAAAAAAYQAANERLEVAQAAVTEEAGATRQALVDLANAIAGSTVAALDAESAVIRTNQAIGEFEKDTRGASTASDEYTLKLNEVETQIINTATKVGEGAVANQTFAREADAAGAKTDAQIGYLRGLADKLSPGDPLRQRLEAYIGELDSIKEQITTTLTVQADQATAKLRELTGYIQQVRGGFDIPIGFTGPGGRAVGGPAGGLTLVGEDGPELAELPLGTNVRTANETRRLLGGMVGGGGTTTVHVYLPAGANGPDLVAALRRWERRNGDWRA